MQEMHGFDPLERPSEPGDPFLNDAPIYEVAGTLLRKTTGWEADAHGVGTPGRFVRMLKELTTPQPFDFTTFEAESDEMIVIQDIPFVSVCNHHVIPFVGKAWIGYIPNNKIAGLSKFARTVRFFAKRLQVQERMTKQIMEFLVEELDPAGLIVMLEAEHFCMTIRGVQTPGAKTTTSEVYGVFADHDRTAKSEFFHIIGR
jgi:GTP cyclohydrolase I